MAVTVVISYRRSHASLLATVFVEGRSRSDGDIGECSVMVVAVENAGGAVACDVDVGPAVFIKIKGRNAQRIMSVCAFDVRLRGYVFECAIAFVVVENVLFARQPARAAHHGNAFPYTTCTLTRRWRSGQIEVHIIRDHEVEF